MQCASTEACNLKRARGLRDLKGDKGTALLLKLATASRP